MTRSPFRTRHVLATGLVGLFLLAACSKQGEGDRCSRENDDNDCDSGLVCIAPLDPASAQDEVSRCCPPTISEVSDSRCARLFRANAGTGTDSGAAGAGGESTSSTSSSTSTTGSTTCTYTSQCPEGMICGPSGTCQAECVGDRDCASGMLCDAGRCVSAGAGGQDGN